MLQELQQEFGCVPLHIRLPLSRHFLVLILFVRYSDEPEEMPNIGATDGAENTDKEDMERQQYEESMLTRLQLTKAQKKKGNAKKNQRISDGLESLISFNDFGDITDMAAEEKETTQEGGPLLRRKTVRDVLDELSRKVLSGCGR